jgi:hypothetical protein
MSDDKIKEALTDMPKATIVMAVKNDSEEEYEFGGKKFKLLDLSYDSYIEFLLLLTPLIEQIFDQEPNSKTDVRALIAGLGKSLPRMVYLMLYPQDPEVTEEWIKEKAKTPYVLVEIAMKQVTKNKMIAEFADFFVSMMGKMRE